MRSIREDKMSSVREEINYSEKIILEYIMAAKKGDFSNIDSSAVERYLPIRVMNELIDKAKTMSMKDINVLVMRYSK